MARYRSRGRRSFSGRRKGFKNRSSARSRKKFINRVSISRGGIRL